MRRILLLVSKSLIAGIAPRRGTSALETARRRRAEIVKGVEEGVVNARILGKSFHTKLCFS